LQGYRAPAEKKEIPGEHGHLHDFAPRPDIDEGNDGSGDRSAKPDSKMIPKVTQLESSKLRRPSEGDDHQPSAVSGNFSRNVMNDMQSLSRPRPSSTPLNNWIISRLIAGMSSGLRLMDLGV
jgi:hypothetical protein